ncbi:PaaI family thioesterase [uncultured Draconibacterium sp.]|uniref:PaaI family thioesterase n=1 Tax=uncultured Draconibacterium sp. TaxID=1573823 RepID=UPI00326054D6
MKKIKNPWKDPKNIGEYNCFACSPYNSGGLHLEFWEDCEEIVTKWNPERCYEGWIGVLHGGIQATLLDEIGGWVVMLKLQTSGVTSDLQVRYLKPVKVSKGELTVRGRLESFEGRIAKISATLYDGEGEECAKADVSYFVFPEKIAKARYQYPGVEAFYEK